MLIANQIIKTKWANRNKSWYVNKGYDFTYYGDILIVKANDLPPHSKIKVKVQCFYCHKIKEIRWKDYYNKYYLKNDKYACINCKQIKVSENTLKQRQKYLYDGMLNTCKEKDVII